MSARRVSTDLSTQSRRKNCPVEAQRSLIKYVRTAGRIEELLGRTGGMRPNADSSVVSVQLGCGGSKIGGPWRPFFGSHCNSHDAFIGFTRSHNNFWNPMYRTLHGWISSSRACRACGLQEPSPSQIASTRTSSGSRAKYLARKCARRPSSFGTITSAVPRTGLINQ